MRKQLTIAALFSALSAGSVYILVDGQHQQVALVDELGATVEITGIARTPIGNAVRDSGAIGVVECARGVISNMPDALYCTDGKTAGFVLEETTADALLTESGADAEAVRLAVEGGRIYAQPKRRKTEETPDSKGKSKETRRGR